MQTKPFHESIIDAINNCSGPGEMARKALSVIGYLIIATKIPKNHEEIMKSFQKAINYWSSDGYEQDMYGLLSIVLNKLKEEASSLLRIPKSDLGSHDFEYETG